MQDEYASLDRDGYLLLRAAIPEAWLEPLRAAFDAGVGTPDQWASPRAQGWRHALVDLDPLVQAACRLPVLLAAVGRLLGEPFMLIQVEGREPLAGGGFQPLHRDGAEIAAVSALLFLDPYGPDNGGTRLVPRPLDSGAPDEALASAQSGGAGDVLVLAPDLLHGATVNRSGARRRSLLLNFVPARYRTGQDASRNLRNIRMDTSETFMP